MSEVRGNMSRRRDLTGNVQLVGNMVTEVSQSSTDSQYPSAKAVEARVKKNGNIKTIGNLSCGEQEGSLYTSDAIPDNLGLGAFAGGYKGQATGDYSFAGGYGSVVGAKGYKINDISVDIPAKIIKIKLKFFLNNYRFFGNSLFLVLIMCVNCEYEFFCV